MSRKVVYFVTEFPGQTHIFLWREYRALLSFGLDINLLATAKPPEKTKPHSWGAEAERIARYLMPFKLSNYITSMTSIVKAGPRAWINIVKVFLHRDTNLIDKLKLIPMLLIAGHVAYLAKRYHWSHIHCTTCANAANITMFASILAPITYSLSLLGPRLETYGPNQHNKWRFASFGLFQSKQLLKHAQKTLGHDLPSRCKFAPVGVDVETMKRSQPYQPWTGLCTCILYCCGRLNRVKGHEFVIEATEILVKEGRDVKLLIAGEDIHGGNSYRKVIESLIEKKQLAHKVTLLGAVSEEKNREGYETAHLYVMGSLDEAAGAVAAMEAMSMELPVVMTDVGATRELITPGKEGILVPPMDSKALALAIKSVLDNPELAIELGQNGRKKVVEEFNHLQSASVIKDFLDELQITTSEW